MQSDYENQIIVVRLQRHIQYLQHLVQKNIASESDIQELKQSQIQLQLVESNHNNNTNILLQNKPMIETQLPNNSNDKVPIIETQSPNDFNDKVTKFIEKQAILKIQRFVKKKLFSSKCINDADISSIPIIYRFRISVTNCHKYKYSESDVDKTFLDAYRIIHNMAVNSDQSIVLFKYCFDIRKIYKIRNNGFMISNQMYYLQPNDHIRINKLWHKFNNNTNYSIKYINDSEYYKSVCFDKYMNIKAY